jgi:hypothetical protein
MLPETAYLNNYVETFCVLHILTFIFSFPVNEIPGTFQVYMMAAVYYFRQSSHGSCVCIVEAGKSHRAKTRGVQLSGVQEFGTSV